MDKKEAQIESESREVFVFSDEDESGIKTLKEYFGCCPYCGKENRIIDYNRHHLCQHFIGLLENNFVFHQQGRPPEKEVLLACMCSDDTYTRHDAVKRLADIRKLWSLDALVEALEDPDESVLRLAVCALGKAHYSRAVPKLIALLASGNFLIRLDVAWALGEIGSTEAVEHLIVAAEDPCEEVAQEAALALKKMGEIVVQKKVFEPLSPALGGALC